MLILFGVITQAVSVRNLPELKTTKATQLTRRAGLSDLLHSDTGLTSPGQAGGKLKDPCGHIELTPQTWVDLQIDQYIASYPGADKLTIQVGLPTHQLFSEVMTSDSDT